MRPLVIGRELAKLIVVVAAAGAVGAGLALGLAEVQGEGEGGVVLTPPTASTQEQSADTSGEEPANTRSPRVRVVSAELASAATDAGQERNRARLTVRVQVTNRKDERLVIRDRVLVVGDEQLDPDPNATEALGELDEPIPSGSTATGTLRFETAGDVTETLISRQRASIRVAGQTVSFRFEIGEPVELAE